MTEEINAAAEGAFSAGATLVLVNDSHLAEHNLDLDILDPRIEYLMGPGKNAWTGLDDSFTAVFQLGAHAMVGTSHAHLRHTWDPSCWAQVKVNGISMGEIGIVAAGAGELGVPCTLVTGDDKACFEAAQLIPNIIKAQVKTGLTWQSAQSLELKIARDLIRESARQACLAAREIKPLILGNAPFDIEVLLIAEPAHNTYASSLEKDELQRESSFVQRASGVKFIEAFLSVLQSKPVPYKVFNVTNKANKDEQ